MAKKPAADDAAIKVKRIRSILMQMTHDGKSLRQACKSEGIAPSTFIDWVDADPALAEQYGRAREALIEHWAEDVIEISDEAVPSTANGGLDSAAVAKQRLQVDSRKWILSKLSPKRFGDKVEQTLQGPNGGPVSLGLQVVGVRPS